MERVGEREREGESGREGGREGGRALSLESARSGFLLKKNRQATPCPKCILGRKARITSHLGSLSSCLGVEF